MIRKAPLVGDMSLTRVAGLAGLAKNAGEALVEPAVLVAQGAVRIEQRLDPALVGLDRRPLGGRQSNARRLRAEALDLRAISGAR